MNKILAETREEYLRTYEEAEKALSPCHHVAVRLTRAQLKALQARICEAVDVTELAVPAGR